MNLQLCMPYELCKFNCSFCIARGHKHNYQFKNVYQTNYFRYLVELQDILMSPVHNIKTIVFTGEADPSQNIQWIQDCLEAIEGVRKSPDYAYIKTELQTKDQRADYSVLQGLDVLSISVSNMKEFNNAKDLVKTYPQFLVRPVIILSKAFIGKTNIHDMDLTPFKQVTFKELQWTEDSDVNEWINKNRFIGRDNLKDLIFSFKDTVSIMYDLDCQNGFNRYLIYRSDAEIYRSWDELPKEEEKEK
jgi:hypothetical protein